jgi:hypothetical protein
MNKAYFYDIESFSNYFAVIFINASPKYHGAVNAYIKADIAKDIDSKKAALREIDYKEFIIFNDRNDLLPLLTFLDTKPMLIGYNNHKYDDRILRFFHYYRNELETLDSNAIALAVHGLSDQIINEKFHEEDSIADKVSKFGVFYTVDLMRTHYLDVKRKSLKQTLISLKWYRIQDLPLKPNAKVSEDISGKIIDYCFNDVLGTREIWFAKYQDIQLRLDIQEKYKVNVLSASRSAMADILFYKIYTNKYGWVDKKKNTLRNRVKLGDVIDDKISFKTKPMRQFLEKLKAKVIIIGNDSTYLNETVTINETSYQLGLGGLHSIDKPGIFIADKSKLYIDEDVGSYYPFQILNRRTHPAHLPADNFINTVTGIVQDRMKAKANSKDKNLSKEAISDAKVAAHSLKIVINSGLFGKLGSESWIKDMKALYDTTINGQLELLMLAEQHELDGIKVISANTDGLLCEVRPDQLDAYYKAGKDWMKLLSFTLEYAQYSKYVRRNVNNYLAVYTNGDVKTKGFFTYDLTNDPDHLVKGFDKPIVAKAVHDFFVKGIPIRNTIQSHIDIYDFCMTKNIGSKYIPELHRVINGEVSKEKLQKNVRYFISKNGGTLLKFNTEVNAKTKYTNLVKGHRVTIFNDFVPKDNMSDYGIHYGYYISEAQKILDEIYGNSVKLIKKGKGTLFD